MTERQVGPTGVSAGGATGASGLAARFDGAPVGAAEGDRSAGEERCSISLV